MRDKKRQEKPKIRQGSGTRHEVVQKREEATGEDREGAYWKAEAEEDWQDKELAEKGALGHPLPLKRLRNRDCRHQPEGDQE